MLRVPTSKTTSCWQTVLNLLLQPIASSHLRHTSTLCHRVNFGCVDQDDDDFAEIVALGGGRLRFMVFVQPLGTRKACTRRVSEVYEYKFRLKLTPTRSVLKPCHHSSNARVDVWPCPYRTPLSYWRRVSPPPLPVFQQYRERDPDRRCLTGE